MEDQRCTCRLPELWPATGTAVLPPSPEYAPARFPQLAGLRPGASYLYRNFCIFLDSLALYSWIDPSHSTIVAPSCGPVHSQIVFATCGKNKQRHNGTVGQGDAQLAGGPAAAREGRCLSYYLGRRVFRHAERINSAIQAKCQWLIIGGSGCGEGQSRSALRFGWRGRAGTWSISRKSWETSTTPPSKLLIARARPSMASTSKWFVWQTTRTAVSAEMRQQQGRMMRILSAQRPDVSLQTLGIHARCVWSWLCRSGAAAQPGMALPPQGSPGDGTVPE